MKIENEDDDALKIRKTRLDRVSEVSGIGLICLKSWRLENAGK